MKKGEFKEVVERIENLSSELVMLDFSIQEEIDKFIDGLKDVWSLVQDTDEKTLDQILALIFKAIGVAGKLDTEKVEKVLLNSMSFFQYAVEERQKGNDPLTEIKAFIDQLDIALGIKDSSQQVMTAAQSKEIPDFITDTNNRIDEIEEDLLSLEKEPDNSEKINAVFRSFHTIKGEANLLGVLNLGGVSHEAENLLEQIRSGQVTIDSDMISTLLGTVDVIKELLKVLAVDIEKGLSFDLSSAKEEITKVLSKKGEVRKTTSDVNRTETKKDEDGLPSPSERNAGKQTQIREEREPSVKPSSADVSADKEFQEPESKNGSELNESIENIEEDAAEKKPEAVLQGETVEKSGSPEPEANNQEEEAVEETIEEKSTDEARKEDPQPTSEGDSGISPKSQKNTFAPKIPELDLSDGTEILTEFATEAYDHLANAEDSILVLELNPDDKESIDNVFRAFHTIKGVASFLDLDDIRILAHESETMLDMVRTGTLPFAGQVVDLTFHATDNLRTLLMLLRKQVANGEGKLTEPYHDVGPAIRSIKAVISGEVSIETLKKEPLGEILIKEGSITDQELEGALAKQKETCPDKKIGEILVEDHAVSQKEVARGLAVQSGGAAEDSIKINIGKLDMLYDLVGELVIGEEQVVQNPILRDAGDQRLEKNISQLNQITRNLQEVSMSMRLVPIRSTFQKMNRLIRDLSKKAKKDISVSLVGEDTEIDKNMVDLVGDPLIHMVRNSVDHGVEPVQDRVAKGKPPQGLIELKAFHKAGNVVIEIKDDGGGLNRDKILKKAIEKGLAKEGENLSDNRVFGMIFEPGFSTAEQVTDVSGRGVGMDVVKRNIERLRGKIEIASQKDEGSVFAINLPITLAIIEGIVLEVGVERYILPITSVVEFIQPQDKEITEIATQRAVIKIHGNLYPIVHLRELFGVKSGYEDSKEMTACLVESELGRSCIFVDKLLGQQQVVIKSLGERLKEVKGLAGATILGDGKVGLILDVNGIVEISREQS